MHLRLDEYRLDVYHEYVWQAFELRAPLLVGKCVNVECPYCNVNETLDIFVFTIIYFNKDAHFPK